MTSVNVVQVVEKSVAINNSSSLDSTSLDDQLSSRYLTPGFKPFSIVLLIYVKKKTLDVFKLFGTV